eukprot:1900321-Ditylum_brightwellii.AAC.1
MLPADKIPVKYFEGWLKEHKVSVGVWRERFALHNTMERGGEKEDDRSTTIGDDFLKRAKEMRTPLKANITSKRKRDRIMEARDDNETNEIRSDIELVRPLKVKIDNDERKAWRGEVSALLTDFVELVEAIEASVKSLILFATSSNATQLFRDSASANVNARLTMLEEYVGGDYEDAAGDGSPT